jgi:outer membrane protein
MRKLNVIIAFVVLFLGAVNTVNAQAKVAHVDTQEIMSKYPAMLDAQKQFEQISKTYQKELQDMVAALEKKAQAYDAEAEGQDDATNEARVKEVQGMEKSIRDYQSNASKELEEKQQKMLAPIYDSVKVAIKKVGKAKGFQYVLDASGLLMADGPDLTLDVKKELGF